MIRTNLPGAQHVVRNGRIIGAVAEKGVPPFVTFPGVDPVKLIVDGKPANDEDLCIAYALRKPYATQHASMFDDEKQWLQAYGKAPEGRGTGLAPAPKATKQAELDAAIRICDAAIAEAKRRNARICGRRGGVSAGFCLVPIRVAARNPDQESSPRAAP